LKAVEAEFYAQEGYLVVPNLIDSNDLVRLREEIDAIQQEVVAAKEIGRVSVP